MTKLSLPPRKTDFGPRFVAHIVPKVIVPVSTNLLTGVAIVELVTNYSVLIDEL